MYSVSNQEPKAGWRRGWRRTSGGRRGAARLACLARVYARQLWRSPGPAWHSGFWQGLAALIRLKPLVPDGADPCDLADVRTTKCQQMNQYWTLTGFTDALFQTFYMRLPRRKPVLFTFFLLDNARDRKQESLYLSTESPVGFSILLNGL
jgi:hypothetical protein